MDTVTISLNQVETALRRLPPQQLKEVLLFIEFLEYLTGNNNQVANEREEEGLWSAVLAHQAYRAAHPEIEVYETPEAFLSATADL